MVTGFEGALTVLWKSSPTWFSSSHETFEGTREEKKPVLCEVMGPAASWPLAIDVGTVEGPWGDFRGRGTDPVPTRHDARLRLRDFPRTPSGRTSYFAASHGVCFW